MAWIHAPLPGTVVASIEHLVQFCYGRAEAAGWWDKERNKGECIALMHSELSEALEGIRKGSRDSHLPDRPSEEVEFADTVIRIADYCGRHGLDLAGAIRDKLEFNKTRADHSREARAAEGGKKF